MKIIYLSLAFLIVTFMPGCASTPAPALSGCGQLVTRLVPKGRGVAAVNCETALKTLPSQQ